eukprot:6209418-Prymnesium_polylepis.1
MYLRVVVGVLGAGAAVRPARASGQAGGRPVLVAQAGRRACACGPGPLRGGERFLGVLLGYTPRGATGRCGLPPRTQPPGTGLYGPSRLLMRHSGAGEVFCTYLRTSEPRRQHA